MLISKHLVSVLSFSINGIQRGKLGNAIAEESIPVEFEMPKPMFLFGKEISVTGSLTKWEQSLTTNTLTNYQEQVSMRAVKITQAKTPQAAQSINLLGRELQGDKVGNLGVPHSTRNANPRLEAMEETK